MKLLIKTQWGFQGWFYVPNNVLNYRNIEQLVMPKVKNTFASD